MIEKQAAYGGMRISPNNTGRVLVDLLMVVLSKTMSEN